MKNANGMPNSEGIENSDLAPIPLTTSERGFALAKGGPVVVGLATAALGVTGVSAEKADAAPVQEADPTHEVVYAAGAGANYDTEAGEYPPVEIRREDDSIESKEPEGPESSGGGDDDGEEDDESGNSHDNGNLGQEDQADSNPDGQEGASLDEAEEADSNQGRDNSGSGEQYQEGGEVEADSTTEVESEVEEQESQQHDSKEHDSKKYNTEDDSKEADSTTQEQEENEEHDSNEHDSKSDGGSSGSEEQGQEGGEDTDNEPRYVIPEGVDKPELEQPGGPSERIQILQGDPRSSSTQDLPERSGENPDPSSTKELPDTGISSTQQMLAAGTAAAAVGFVAVKASKIKNGFLGRLFRRK